MSEVTTDYFASFDGERLAIHRLGEGRPVILLHGLYSDAATNWIRFGHAALLSDAGFSVIMPDLRAHGASASPHDPAAYPPDVLVRDLEALVAHLGLAEFDLGGFSLGARTALQGVLGGLVPRRLVLGGVGLEGLSGWAARAAFFIDAIDRFDQIRHGDPAFFAVSFMKTQKIDRVAARLLLQTVGEIAPGELARADMPVLIACGADDRDNGSPAALAAALPQATFVEIPGTHMSSVTGAALGQAFADFLLA